MDSSPKQLWEFCRQIIRQNVSPEQYMALFAYTEFSSYADDELVLSVPTQFVYDMLERDDYANLILTTIRRVYGENARLKGYKIPVVQRPQGQIIVEANQTPIVPNGTQMRPANESPDMLLAPAVEDLDSQLHKGYVFENYLEGESNRLARSVGEAIAKKPASTFNPFFVFGPSGCGKTHLVNAIGWRIKQLHPSMRVLYISAHLFYVQYADAVKQNKTNELIQFYQTIDVLIIDDIQEFSGKLKTQNTFFHIFNHLHLNNKQLILTADRPPVKIEGLEDRLLTRFKWGMLAEVEKPTMALRRAILKNKVKKDGLRIPESVINFIADNLDESVRDLEGMLNSLMAHSIVDNCEISMSLAQKLLPRFVTNIHEASKRTVEDIKQKVCAYFNTKEELILSKSRKQEIVYVRQIAIYLASKYTDQSTVQIGKIIGDRSHATVIHSIHQINNLIDTDERTRNDISALEAIL